eukprot:CAMPEP_0171199530 /NCGR_PEP_ID=MMETSP0790-20130122/23511_1 /TAXON_ID=2925 /ORGANISM="Alexandrium catenella, Strain OF101" /LENGTH=75 /DNA_ID=CAMNT_0011664879 /DNA_START=84 /DNA_END=308 /DNA_ORIENTATION=+
MRQQLWVCLLLGAPVCTASTNSGLRVRSVATAEDNEQPMSTATSKVKRSQAEKIKDWKQNINERMAKASEGVNKG